MPEQRGRDEGVVLVKALATAFDKMVLRLTPVTRSSSSGRLRSGECVATGMIEFVSRQV